MKLQPLRGHFEATVALALTAMLVMLTLHQSVSEDLPKTANIKFIDVWLIAGMILPFVVFMIVIGLELITDSHTRRRTQNCCKVFIPVTTSLFVLFFLAISLFIYVT